MNSTDQIPHEQQKKHIRRRRQSRRLYKEGPLNMAEARREIVAALKLHRASIKERQQKQKQIKQHPLPLLPQLCPYLGPQGRMMKSRRNPRIYPAFSLYSDNTSDFSRVFSLSTPITQNLNTESPIQTSALNPNFLDSKTVDTSSVVSSNSRSFCSLSFLPPSSSYTCPSVSYAATRPEFVESVTLSEEGKLMASCDVDCSSVPNGENGRDMEEKEVMAEKAVEIDVGHIDMKGLEIDGHHSFDEAVEFPDWLSISDDFLQQHSSFHLAEDYVLDPDLSCMDIGEIEDVDGDWLA